MNFKEGVNTFVIMTILSGILFMVVNNFNVGFKWYIIVLLASLIGLFNEWWGEE